MLATESRQVGFFDAAELVRPLPEGSFYALLAAHGERIVSDEDFADCYPERQGRPSIPPSKLAKVLLLQHRTGLSDEQAMEAVCWDLRWKVALGLAVDDEGWHPTAMTKFRARLLLHGKERRRSRTRCGSPRSSACSRRPPSRSSTRRRCSVPPRPRTPSGSCVRACAS